jgi:hypothetical protein
LEDFLKKKVHFISKGTVPHILPENFVNLRIPRTAGTFSGISKIFLGSHKNLPLRTFITYYTGKVVFSALTSDV